jgi:transcriptional regulator with XRE-family HTH domain
VAEVIMSQTFAVKLKQLREAAGISQLELATRAGMNQFTVAKLEQGQREPSLQTAQALARALGVSLSAFDGVVFGDARPDQSAAKPKPGRPRKGARAASDQGGPSGEETPAVKKRSGKRKGG